MRSRLYEGWVRHRRHAPTPHEFRYRLFQPYLDLDELPGVLDGRLLWSARRPALAWFRRQDHFGDPSVSLAEAVRTEVARQTGARPAGPIGLLTHLRYFGYCFNPVSFYYCWDASGASVEFLLAEVTNTPWGKRHCYVVDLRGGAPAPTPKALHVSPFMGMEQEYRWRVGAPGERLTLFLESREAGAPVFDASLDLRARPITTGNLSRALLRFPFMTGQVLVWIYWQALRLWVKGVRYRPPPGALEAGRMER